MPSPESRQIRDILKNQVKPLFPGNVTVETQRQITEMMASQVQLPEDISIEPANIPGIKAEWVTAPGAERERVIYYLHGGGYVLGYTRTYQEFLYRLSKVTGLRVLALDYRLAPEYPFPAGLEDALVGYRWLLANGTKPENLVIAGDSAGGGLTEATLLSLREAGDPLPVCQVLFSPWTDMEGIGETYTSVGDNDPWIGVDIARAQAKRYVGNGDLRHPLVSPIYADLKGLPPMLIYAGKDEILLDDSVRLANKARADGVEVSLNIWDDMWHVFPLFAGQVPEAQQALDEVGAYIRQRLGLSVAAASS